jgi:hypothetical protein
MSADARKGIAMIRKSRETGCLADSGNDVLGEDVVAGSDTTEGGFTTEALFSNVGDASDQGLDRAEPRGIYC